MSNPHTIGVVGGLGPYAGLDLVQKIFDHTIAHRDQEHFRVLLHSCPSDIPVRPEFLLGLTKENPGKAIGEIMVGLVRAGATILAMPCNTAHCPPILNLALTTLTTATTEPVRFLHIIDAACAYLSEKYPRHTRIGLMGTVATLRTGLYQDALNKAGFEPVLPDDAACQRVQAAISDPVFGIKAASHPVTERAAASLRAEAIALIRQNIDVLLLGCTEIPLALTEKHLEGVPVVDVTAVLARTIIRTCDPARLKPES